MRILYKQKSVVKKLNGEKENAKTTVEISDYKKGNMTFNYNSNDSFSIRIENDKNSETLYIFTPQETGKLINFLEDINKIPY